MKPKFTFTGIIAAMLLSSICIQVKAQDLIVKERGDSLNCKIVNIKRDSIYFVITSNDSNEMLVRVLPMSRIQHYKKDFYVLQAIQKEKERTNGYPKIRIGIQFGWSKLTRKKDESTPGVFKKYAADLRSGHSFGSDFTLFPSKNIGVGVRYASFGARGTSDRFSVQNQTGQVFSGTLTTRATINYLGPSFSLRAISLNEKVQFITDLSLGYMSYKENSLLLDYSYTYKGEILGYTGKTELDIAISNNLALGLSASCSLGRLKKVKVSDSSQHQTIHLTKANYYDISRTDISVGLRWNK